MKTSGEYLFWHFKNHSIVTAINTQLILNLLNFQIEREKCDLSVQVITLSERLEEAEGGAESQVMRPFLTSTLMLLNSIFPFFF